MSETREYSAFISHSSKDAAVANELVDKLEARGLSTWISTRDIPVGADWEQEIMNGLRASKCLVLLFSGAAESSKHVSREVSQADKADKVIIPVRIDEFPGDKFDYVLDRVQWISAIDGLKDALIESLAKRIAEIHEGGSGSRPPQRTARRVDDPFSVPLNHTGPILPTPKPGEVWADTFGEREREEIAKLDTGENSEFAEMNKISWAGQGKIVLGGNKSVFFVDADRGSCNKVFSAPNWRGRYITDLCVSPRRTEIFLCGNSFTCRLSRDTRFSHWGFLGYAFERDFVWDRAWNRILVTPKGDWVLHTASRIGHRSKNPLKRFLTIPDDLKRYDTTHHYDILSEFREKLDNPEIPPPVALTGDPVGSLGPQMDICWSPSGKFFGIHPRGLRGGYVTVFDPHTVSDPMVFRDLMPLTSPDRVVGCLAWHPTRDIYACGYWAKDETPQHGFIIVDAATREVIHERPLERSGETTSLDWSPDGRFLALGGEDNAIFLWDFSRDAASTILGHKDQVGSVFFSPDGKRLLSSGGSEIMVWDPLNPGAEIARMEGGLGPGLRSSPWSPDGQRIMMFAGQGVRVVALQ